MLACACLLVVLACLLVLFACWVFARIFFSRAFCFGVLSPLADDCVDCVFNLKFRFMRSIYLMLCCLWFACFIFAFVGVFLNFFVRMFLCIVPYRYSNAYLLVVCL